MSVSTIEALNTVNEAIMEQFDPNEYVPVYSVALIQDVFEESVSYLLVRGVEYDELKDCIRIAVQNLRNYPDINRKELLALALELAETGKKSADVRKDFKAALSKVEDGYELSEVIHWSLSSADLRNLARLHKDNVFREKIEELLEDCNFHKENADFYDGRYEDYLLGGMDKAKKLINDFCRREYDSDADFSDLHNVGLAHTTLTDEELPVQVTADLLDCKITYTFNDKVYDVEQYKDIDDMADNGGLENLEFEDLIHGAYDVMRNEEDIEPPTGSDETAV